MWCPSDTPVNADPLELGIRPIRDTGFVHLGAPVGSQVFIYSSVKKRVDKVNALLECLPALQNPHAEFVLLRACFSLPKVSYILRTCSPSASLLQLWNSFDSMVRDSLNRILGASLNDSSWLQAQLPISRGGLGIRSTLKHCSAAFLASISSSSAIVEDLAPSLDFSSVSNEEVREHLSSVLEMEETIPDEVSNGMSQRVWCHD